ncbi:MAG: hypothetical protein KBB77_02315 [Candidatus Moranbacteria bacterium]|jgi:hypothetical protein|nr:hypothetical protein [Candidatus Moranbacteria bacterium]
MSDSDEAADGQFLAYQEAKKLHQTRQDHPLLKYALYPDDDVVWEEFVAKFGKPGLTREQQKAYPAVAYMYAMYWVTLRQANQNPHQEIMVNHGPSWPVTSTVTPLSRAGSNNITDDDIPF